MTRLHLLRPFAAALLVAALAGCAATTIPAIHSEPERLDQARKALARGDANVAVELLKTYVANNAGGADVDLAVELLGESYLKMKEWSSAQGEFERVLRDYPESDSGGAAAYHLGEALWGQARGPDFDQEFTRKALEQWQSYLRGYPGHWLNARAEAQVGEARRRLAEKLTRTGMLYLKLRLPAPARVYFERVRDEFPDTPQAGEAQLGLALADARQGRRREAIGALRELETRYHGQPLAERAARERAKLEREKT